MSGLRNSLSAVRGYVGANVQERLRREGVRLLPSIAITRQTGSRAVTIANKLLERLNARSKPDSSKRWRLYEKDLVNYVLRQHGLSESLAKYYPENSTPYVEDALEDIVGLHPSAYTINERCHRAIVDLCQEGHAIIIGRACNFLARDLANTLRIRFVGTPEVRTRHIIKVLNLDQRHAEEHIRNEDTLRKRYARMNFNHSDVDNPQRYDLVFNTDHLPDETIIDLIEIALNRIAG